MSRPASESAEPPVGNGGSTAGSTAGSSAGGTRAERTDQADRTDRTARSADVGYVPPAATSTGSATPTGATPTGATPTRGTPTGSATPTTTGAIATSATTTGAESSVADRIPAQQDGGRLVPEERAGAYATRWDAVKVAFVDDPRQAVAQADALVREVVEDLLRAEHGRDGTSTEDLRLALLRYRSLFDRLTSL